MAKIISNGQELVLPSGGVADVTVDSTLTKSDDGTIGVTTPVKAILTREAFEALLETERSTGMYVVYDEEDESSTPSTPGGSGSSAGEVYSEEETVIGRWIDGKPLYRKVVNGNLSSTKNGTSTISTIPNADDVVTMHGYAVYSDPSRITSIPTGFDGGTTVQLSAIKTVDGTQIEAFNSTSLLVGRPCTIIVEYTKTTDTATS